MLIFILAVYSRDIFFPKRALEKLYNLCAWHYVAIRILRFNASYSSSVVLYGFKKGYNSLAVVLYANIINSHQYSSNAYAFQVAIFFDLLQSIILLGKQFYFQAEYSC